MKWKKLSLETTTVAVDLVCDMLLSLGIEGIEVVDKVNRVITIRGHNVKVPIGLKFIGVLK